jgi:putative addiction module component (TIGR02574 family)
LINQSTPWLFHATPRYNLSMPMTAHDLLEAANRLSQADREWLARELLHPPGDGSSEAEIEAAWGEEIKRRLDEIDSGAVQMIPMDDVVARMKARISAKQRA